MEINSISLDKDTFLLRLNIILNENDLIHLKAFL